jgi:hypothetical protein
MYQIDDYALDLLAYFNSTTRNTVRINLPSCMLMTWNSVRIYLPSCYALNVPDRQLYFGPISILYFGHALNVPDQRLCFGPVSIF